jgi:hypothetical protein
MVYLSIGKSTNESEVEVSAFFLGNEGLVGSPNQHPIILP